MNINETVLIANPETVHATGVHPAMLSADQVAVHVLTVSGPGLLTRNELRSTVRPQREMIIKRYAATDIGVKHSIAYGQDVAVLAVRFHHTVGIDIEPLSSAPRADIAETFFAPHEQALLLGYPKGPAREDAFRHLWTLKEAALKCAGGTVPSNLGDVWAQTAPPTSLPSKMPLGWSEQFLKAHDALKKDVPQSALLFRPCANHIAAVAFTNDA